MKNQNKIQYGQIQKLINWKTQSLLETCRRDSKIAVMSRVSEFLWSFDREWGNCSLQQSWSSRNGCYK